MKLQLVKKDIEYISDLMEFCDLFDKVNPWLVGFDTETTGLHIIKDKPFLLAFGFFDTDTNTIYSYTMNLDKNEAKIGVRVIFDKLKTAKYCSGRNIKFDLHMMENYNIPYDGDNVIDSGTLIRLSHDAKSKQEGGAPIGLKDYAAQYIDPQAKNFEKKLKDEIKIRRKENTKVLLEMLKGTTVPEELRLDPKRSGWTMKIIDTFLKDKTNAVEDLPLEVAEIYNKWEQEVERPDDYSKLNRANVREYAHYDIIYDLATFLSLYDTDRINQQQSTLERERKLIKPLMEMERVGFKFDRKYVEECYNKTVEYVLSRRKDMCNLAGEELSVGQHAKIKNIFLTKWNVDLDGTSLEYLHQVYTPNQAVEFAETIVELRTLEKWLSTYMAKWLTADYNGRVYTTINSSGAVSGRVSSDFQQFPKAVLTDKDGNELFSPRKMITVTGGDYPYIVYLDYSQIELRVQAIYTMLVMGGDENLCRAFMPFKCDEATWKPTDLHSLTAKLAFGVDETHPDFKNLRSKGKVTNFACNYGATTKTLANNASLQVDYETADRLFKGYQTAYPGVVEYRKYVEQMVRRQGYVENLFGRRYYGSTGHKCCNYLVQGSSADFLKIKIIEIHEYLKDKKSKFQMNIHDEMSFEIHKDELHILKDLMNIMEQLDNTPVPIVVDSELTTTNWAEKEDYHVER